MGKQIKHNYDANTGRSEVIIWDKGKKYRGTATVHEEDKDVMNQYTGLTIANTRAEIKRAESKSSACEKEIQKLQGQLLVLITRQFNYDKDAADMRKNLEQYIKDKAEFAKKLRKRREKDATKEEK